MPRIELETFWKKRTKLRRGFPTGTVFFTGAQGAGKSLSATHYLARLKKKYPDLYIYSNIKLAIADKIITSDQVAEHILDRKVIGELCGTCEVCTRSPDAFDDGTLCSSIREVPIAFFIDEIQTVLFNNKKAVSFETFKAICQQRKALKTIIGTMQEFLDLDIKYRRQLYSFVECFHFGPLQFEIWKDPTKMKYDQNSMDYIAPAMDWAIWKRHNEAYKIYDTFEIVNASMQVDEEKRQQHSKPQQQLFVGSAPT